MISSLLLGLVLALVHHGMNEYLNNQLVDQTGRTSQQWTSRYAITLAFLIKSCFVACAGTAFVQRQWLSISTHQQSIKVKDLDNLSNGLINFFSLFAGSVWFSNPLLWLMAIISW